MGHKVGRICAAGEKYMAADGSGEKTRWINCGVLLLTDKGYRIKLDAIPVSGDGWFAVFEDDQNAQRPTQTRQEPARPAPTNTRQAQDDFDPGSIPF
jgi:hypothetical protein